MGGEPEAGSPSPSPRFHRYERQRKRDPYGQCNWAWTDELSGADLGGGPSALVVGLVVVAVWVLLWVLVVPVVLFAFDLLLFLAVLAGGVAFKVLFRRPWKVEAPRSTRRTSHTRGVVGLRASGNAVETVARALKHGKALHEIKPASELR